MIHLCVYNNEPRTLNQAKEREFYLTQPTKLSTRYICTYGLQKLDKVGSIGSSFQNMVANGGSFGEIS